MSGKVRFMPASAFSGHDAISGNVTLPNYTLPIIQLPNLYGYVRNNPTNLVDSFGLIHTPQHQQENADCLACFSVCSGGGLVCAALSLPEVFPIIACAIASGICNLSCQYRYPCCEL